MTELAFLSPDRAAPEARLASPLARALAGETRVRDLSLMGKIEVRGDLEELDVDAEVVRITDRRALLLCPYERCAAVRESLGMFGVDLTGALAGLELEGEGAMRRVTDLDLDALPAAGKVADAPAIVIRDGDRFRIFVPQELGHHVAEVVIDALDGLA